MYIDGFVNPVPSDNKHAYRDFAAKAASMFQDYGATRVVEGWGDDVPDGKVTDFRRAVQASERETVVFAWIEWPDKPTRDAGMEKMREDPRMQPGAQEIPFDGKRMIFGGFDCVVDTDGL